MKQEAVTAALTRPNEAESRESTRADRTWDPEPVGQCPYCHQGLERRTITQGVDIGRATFGATVPARIVLLVFWACTNDECCLMFWRHPRMAAPAASPPDGECPRH